MSKLFGNKEEVLQARIAAERNESAMANTQETQDRIPQNYGMYKHETVEAIANPDCEGGTITTTTIKFPESGNLQEIVSKTDAVGEEYYYLRSDQRKCEDGLKLCPSKKKELIGGLPYNEQVVSVYNYGCEADEWYDEDDEEYNDESKSTYHLNYIDKAVTTTDHRTDDVVFKTTIDSTVFPHEEDEDPDVYERTYARMNHMSKDKYSFEEVRMYESDGKTVRTRRILPCSFAFDGSGFAKPSPTAYKYKEDKEFNRTIKSIRYTTRYDSTIKSVITVDGPDYNFTGSKTKSIVQDTDHDTYVVMHPIFKGKILSEIENDTIFDYRTVRTYDYEYVDTVFGKALRTTMIEVHDKTDGIKNCIGKQAGATDEYISWHEASALRRTTTACDITHRHKRISFEVMDHKYKGSTFSFEIFNDEIVTDADGHYTRECIGAVRLPQFIIKENTADAEYRYFYSNNEIANREFGESDNVNDIINSIIAEIFERFEYSLGEIFNISVSPRDGIEPMYPANIQVYGQGDHKTYYKKHTSNNKEELL